MRYTAPQAAEALQDLLRRADGSAPNISRDDIKTLAAANLLTNRSTTSIPRFDAADIKHLGTSVRYVGHSEICGIAAAGLVYKVSVLPRPRAFHEDGSWGWEPNPVVGVNGRLLRDHMGVDYSENPLSRTALGGFEGVWPISAKNADALAQNRGLLLASCKGYVGPAITFPSTGRRGATSSPNPSRPRSKVFLARACGSTEKGVRSRRSCNKACGPRLLGLR